MLMRRPLTPLGPIALAHGLALAISAGLLAAQPAVATPQASAPANAVAFIGVTLVPMDRERLIVGQTVVVRDGRIVSMGPRAAVKIPADANVIDASGKYLIPGLAEMHAHVPPANAPPAVTERVLALYLANGITTIRGMLGDASHLALRARLASGEQMGPRLITSGPSFNNNSVKTVQAGVDSVLSQKRAGFDLLKIHPGLSRELFDSVAATANRVGIPFSGHVPFDVGYGRAITSRYATIDHADGLLEALIRDGAPVNAPQGGFFGLGLVDHLDLGKLPALANATRDAHVWIVPTAQLMETMTNETPAESLAVMPEMRYWFPNQVRAWVLNKQNLVGTGAFTPEQRQKFIATRRAVLLGMHKAGAGFLLGSDSPQLWNVPGFSTHRELEALVRSGFTPYEALRTGTVNIAEYLGEPATSGTLAIGKVADLVLVDGNPLADVRNAARIAGVMTRGRWLDRTEIDRSLAALRQP